MVIRSSCILFLFFFLISCGSKTFESPEEMLAYINDEDNGFKQSKIINGVEYTLLYKPTDLLVVQEASEKPTKKEIIDLRKKYDKYLYFNLSMALNGKEILSSVAGDKAKFGQMVNNLAFNMDQKVHVFTPSKDTLVMNDFIYPRMYGMTNSTTIMLVYTRESKFLKNGYLNFVIEDLAINTGDVKFKISTQPLKNEPQLNF